MAANPQMLANPNAERHAKAFRDSRQSENINETNWGLKTNVEDRGGKLVKILNKRGKG